MNEKIRKEYYRRFRMVLWLKSELHSLNKLVYQQLPAPYKRLIDEIKQN